MKRKTLKQLRDQLWRITSKIVRLRGVTCYTCDKCLPDIKDRQCGHYYTKKGHPRTRFDWDNLRIQCFSCNHYMSGNIQEFAARLIEEIGLERFNRLRLLAKSNERLRRDELEDMITERKEILKQLDAL